MMTEHEPFLQPSKSHRQWEFWDVLFYILLLIPLLLIFVFGQVLLSGKEGKPSGSREILIPFPQNNDSSGFPMTTKGPQGIYNYNSLPLCEDVKVTVNTTSNWRAMESCQAALLQRFFGNVEAILPNFASVLYVCDDTQRLSGIHMREFASNRRTYYAAMPKCRENSTLVTLGIDPDPQAENQLKSLVPDLKLFGTSSTGHTDKIFEKVFPKAISEDGSGFEDYFKSELNGVKFVDILWINQANGPLEYWKIVSKDGLFDKLGLTFCQVGLEVSTEEAKVFYGFMLNVLNNPRYLFMRPTMSEDEKTVRFVLMNTVDERCYRKYVQ